MLVFSCEKEDDIVISGENKAQRIKSIKQYTEGILDYVSNYTYDDYGRLISCKDSYIDKNGEIMRSYKYIFKYKTNIITEYGDYQTGINPEYKTEREIENGMVLKIIRYHWNGEAWDIVTRIAYKYNDSNLSSWNRIDLPGSLYAMLECFTEGEIVYDGNLPIQKIENHQYYNNLFWTSENSFWTSENKSTSYSKQIYNYSDRYLQEVTNYSKNNLEEWLTNSKLEFQRSGQEITKYSYDFSQEGSWVLRNTTILTYDEQAFLTNSKTTYPESDYATERVTEYENKPGNWELALENPDQNIWEVILNK